MSTQDNTLEQELALLFDMEQPGQEEEFLSQDIVEDPPKENVDSEATQEPSSDDSEQPGEAEDENEEDREPEPLAERLKEFEDLLDPEPDSTIEATPRNVLARLQAEAKQLELDIQNSPLYRLPQGGIYTDPNGKWVFQMTEGEINHYLTELKDNGQEFQAAQVQTAILDALQEIPRLQQKQQLFQHRMALIDEQTQILEWKEFKDEIHKKLPELTQEDFDRIGDYVDSLASTDPAFAAAIRSKEGKVKHGVAAAQKLGILQRLKQQATPRKETTPAAPDAGVVSKRVKSDTKPGIRTFKRSEVERMTQAEFNKLPENVVDALLRGDNIIDD